MKSSNTNRFALALGLALLLPGVASAQTRMAASAAPTTVLLFPAASSAGGGEAAAPASEPGGAITAARQLEEMVTDAVRKHLSGNGVSVILYDRRLPSIERAVAEGTLKLDDVAGPGDDPRKAQRLADLAGASEYVSAIIEDYRYDPATRTASINLTLSRNMTSDGSALGTAASPGTGIAPEDVARSRQEGSAGARAAEAAAEQTVDRLFPAPPPPPESARFNPARSSIGNKDRLAFGIIGGLLGLIILTR